jgi:hypothetical protein
MRFPGETEEVVKGHLDEALGTLPFRTLYSYVIFDDPEAGRDLLKSARVENVVDAPGAPQVFLTLSVELNRQFYLPRDPATGQFVDIEKQTQCLSALRTSID